MIRKASETWIALILALILLAALAFCVAAGAASGTDVDAVFSDADVDWRGGWQTRRGDSVRLPCRTQQHSESFTMHKGLPTRLPENAVVVVSTSYLPVIAALNGEPLPVTGTFIDGIAGVTYANSRSVIRIPSSAGGQTLSLTLLPVGSKSVSELYSVQLGSAAEIYAHFLHSGERINLFGLLLLIGAVGLFLFGGLMALRREEAGYRDFLFVALFLLLSGIWFLADSGENTLRFGSSGAYLFINLFSFVLLPSAFLLYVRNNCRVGRRLLLALSLLPAVQVALTLIFLLLGKFCLSLTLSISHACIVVLQLSGLICLGFDRFQNHNRAAGMLLWSMLMLAVTGIATMISFYWHCSPDNTSYFRYGTAAFGLYVAMRTISKAVSAVVEAKSVDSLRYAAEHDALTGLYNAQSFNRAARELLDRNRGRQYVVGCFDFEKFRLINDVFGREQGDALLRHTAAVLMRAMRHRGPYGRLESDKFVFCLPAPVRRAEALCAAIQDEVAAYPLDYVLTLSFGLFLVEDRSLSIDAMVDRAALARQTVKGRFIGRIAYYDDALRRTLLYEQSIVNFIDAALSGEQLRVLLQPKYDLDTGAINGAEALVRWQHPSLGAINPGEFIPVLEKNGLILRVDEYIWRQACVILAGWIARFGEANTPPISINVSRLHLFRANFSELISDIVAHYGVPPRLLALEITESVYSEAPELLTRITDELHEKGFAVHMDDFGSGYSSLNMLKNVDVDVLKLDMLFLFGESLNRRSMGILKAVSDMAHALDVYVIAEGVETAAQVELLKQIGCRGAQGFYFCKPVPPEEVTQMLTARAVSRATLVPEEN